MTWRILMVAAVVLAPALRAEAWGPHKEITKVALEVLPEPDRWKAELGAANLESLVQHCLMPDEAHADKRDYAVDDYLIIRAQPTLVDHKAPGVKAAVVPHFRRCLQALRTETPTNACRQIGPLLHYVEDLGAPPHSGQGIPQHGPLENWVKAGAIMIAGYKPRLLGKTDDEALASLLVRLEDLRAYAEVRKDRALVLVKKGEGERPNVEPILLESALESARASADFLYTVFVLGLAKGPAGAGLEGVIEAPAYFPSGGKGARVVLLDDVICEELAKQSMESGNFVACATDYATLATTAPGAAAGAGAAGAAGWRGEFKFRNLAPGRYRVLAYRPGARWEGSEPVRLEAGKTATVRLTLPPAEPPGNVIQNPDGQLAYLPKNVPDRWIQTTKLEGKTLKNRVWASAKAVLPGGVAYRCGAVLNDPSAKVRFWFDKTDPKDAAAKKRPAMDRCEAVDLATGETRPAEVRYTPPNPSWVLVTIETQKPWAAAVERVWVVPEDKGGTPPK